MQTFVWACLEFANDKVPHGRVHFLGADPRVTCHVGHTINYAKARLSLTIPAHCLGSPRWVRVDFDAQLFDHNITSYDIAFANGEHGVHDGVAFSGRVYRS